MREMNQQCACVCVFVCVYVCVVKGKGQAVIGAIKKNKTGEEIKRNGSMVTGRVVRWSFPEGKVLV